MLAAINAGDAVSWLTFAGVALAAYLIYRGGGSVALSVLQGANEVLEKRVHELERAHAEDARLIADLQAKTDVAIALQPLHDDLRDHARQAEARSERLLAVLEMIAARLGPEPNGGNE